MGKKTSLIVQIAKQRTPVRCLNELKLARKNIT